MAEVAMSSSSESDDELALEVLSGFVKTVYKTVKEEGILSSNKSDANPVAAPGFKAEKPKKPPHPSLIFQELLFRAAKSLHLEDTVGEPNKPRFLGKDNQDRVLLPLSANISRPCHRVWKKPAFAAPVIWGMQKKYRGQSGDAVLTSSHPPADSVVVFTASGGRTTKGDDFPIPGKEPKSMDSIGKKLYQSAGLGLKQANMAAVMSRYNQQLWSQLLDLLEALPEDSKNKALEIQKEGLALSTSSIQVGLDQADVSARTMTTGILQRRRVWLSNAGYPPAVVNKVLDLPFDGTHLFHSSTEKVIERAESEPHRGKVLGRVGFLRPPKRYRSAQPDA